jgi:hypothetical protein
MTKPIITPIKDTVIDPDDFVLVLASQADTNALLEGLRVRVLFRRAKSADPELFAQTGGFGVA